MPDILSNEVEVGPRKPLTPAYSSSIVHVDDNVDTRGSNSRKDRPDGGRILTMMRKQDDSIAKQMRAPYMNLVVPLRVEPPPILNLAVPFQVEPEDKTEPIAT